MLPGPVTTLPVPPSHPGLTVQGRRPSQQPAARPRAQAAASVPRPPRAQGDCGRGRGQPLMLRAATAACGCHRRRLLPVQQLCQAGQVRAVPSVEHAARGGPWCAGASRALSWRARLPLQGPAQAAQRGRAGRGLLAEGGQELLLRVVLVLLAGVMGLGQRRRRLPRQAAGGARLP
jgi:hypothetical protein